MFFKRQNNSSEHADVNALTNTWNTSQLKPDKCIQFFHHLTVLLSLEKGAYPPPPPPNIDMFCIVIFN